MASGTRLHHLSANNLVELEKAVESLRDKVEIKSINFVKSKWYVHFTVFETQFWQPVTEENREKPFKNKE